MVPTKDKGLEFFQNSKSFDKLHKKIYGNILIKTDFDEELSKDICFAAYEKALNKVKEGVYQEENKFIAWVLIMAQNLLVDYYRRQTKFKDVSKGPISFDDFVKYAYEVRDEALEELTIEVIDIESEVGKLLKQQLKKIPRPQAQVVELVFYQGYQYKDIAKEYKMSINTALGRMRYALRNLRIINEKDSTLSDLTR